MVFTIKGLNFDKFKSEGLHEKHAVATWNFETSQHLLEGKGKPGKPRKPVSSWPVA
jgi:hypothetical protein